MPNTGFPELSNVGNNLLIQLIQSGRRVTQKIGGMLKHESVNYDGEIPGNRDYWEKME